MAEFFKPWRRKIGVLTLVVALAFACGWMRSQSRADIFELQQRTFSLVFISGDNKFLLSWRCGFDAVEEATHNSNSVRFVVAHDRLVNDKYLHWQSILTNKVSMEGTRSDGSQPRLVPYWTVVFPLILLSAYLLLTKSRKLTQEKITERIPEKLV